MSSSRLHFQNIILDRDGTLIKECHYLCDPGKVEIIPGVIIPMRRLYERGTRFYLITNQSGIGRGYFSISDYEAVQKRLVSVLRAGGITLAETLFCPHAPEEACACRKPEIGMWHDLVAHHQLDPERTVMIGDKRADITFGLNASLYTILVQTGHGRDEAAILDIPILQQDILQIEDRYPGQPHAVAKDLGSALEWINRIQTTENNFTI